MAVSEVTIEVDGVPIKALQGQMLIEVTDRAGIYVPRFCYHPKLTVAANCRMCLVDVEKAPKPLPACATPVVDGMKVLTRSPLALSAQKATMEFLLINHPLDCPICDQGGECELQDLAMGYGRDLSRYTEGKRVVRDKDLGPLVSTDMTRCIHCTRCVRFGREIAGVQELGTIGRGDRMEISTYIERSVDHELSGNIIDVCPVGALNNKPFRFAARAWEMAAKPLVSPHDCAGSNAWGHTLRRRLLRVVPRPNEAINETWLSDRDRYGCYGADSEERLLRPMVKVEQEWSEVSWQEALAAAARALRQGAADEGDALGVLVSPSATLEEMYLLNRLTRHLGSDNLDHRLRRRDFRDQAFDPPWPWLGSGIAELEAQQGILLVGSNLRAEVPILAHRVRKAALGGTEVGLVNPLAYEQHFAVRAVLEAPMETLAATLAGVLVAAAERTAGTLPEWVAPYLEGVTATAEHGAAAGVLLGKERALLLLGHLAQRHPHFADLRAVAAALCQVTGARLGYIAEGANGVGAALAGILPHRGPGARALEKPGLDTAAMLSAPRHVYLTFGLEPRQDLAEGALAEEALKSADAVVCFTSFASQELLECSDVLLPIATFAETAGTYVNASGEWQSFEAAADPAGEARPGWRVLRVLGNELDLPECEYYSAADVRAALVREIGTGPAPDNHYRGQLEISLEAEPADLDEIDVPIYAVDPLVRRSRPLQQTRLARQPRGAATTRASRA